MTAPAGAPVGEPILPAGQRRVLVLTMHRQDQHANVRKSRTQPAGRFDAVGAAHVDVHEYKVHLLGSRLPERVFGKPGANWI